MTARQLMAHEYKTHLAKRPNQKCSVGEPLHKMRMLDQDVTVNFAEVNCSVCLGKMTEIDHADHDKNKWVWKWEMKSNS